MFRILAGRGSKLVFLLVLIIGGSLAQAQNDTVKGIWDTKKYISRCAYFAERRWKMLCDVKRYSTYAEKFAHARQELVGL